MWTCLSCTTTREKPAGRLPKAWKRLGEDTYCSDCWRKQYILRAIAIPVSTPLDCDWKEFRAALSEMWRATTQASNWMLTELYSRDIRRSSEDKMPPMARVYLYPETRSRFPQLPSQSAAALEQAVQGKYRAARYKVIWTCAASLPTYRYPTPFAIPNQGWSVIIDQQRIVVSCRIGEKRLRLRLRGGAGFRRQRRSVEQIIAGQAIQGELALYERGDDVMCKMVAWLPRSEAATQQKGQRSGILRVRTDSENLIIALNDKDERLWVYHADHLRRWVAEHKQRVQNWADDSKAEQRPKPSFAERRSAAVHKQRHRMSSACQEVSAMIAGYANHRKFAAVRYDDSVKTFCQQFPWYRLRQLLGQKLDAYGIELEILSGEVTPESGEPLAVEEIA